MKFKSLAGRVLKDSIYRDFVPLDVEDHIALVQGFDKLSHLKRLIYSLECLIGQSNLICHALRQGTIKD